MLVGRDFPRDGFEQPPDKDCFGAEVETDGTFNVWPAESEPDGALDICDAELEPVDCPFDVLRPYTDLSLVSG